MTTRSATKYPSLFNNYWGAFTLPRNADAITPEIIANRNQFVEEFNIVRQATWQILQAFANSARHDHPEAYRTAAAGVILVCSNYSGLPDARWGMRVYRQLYSAKTITYIRTFNSTAEMRAVMKGIK